MENNMGLPWNGKNETILSSSNPTSGYLSKGNKNTTSNRYLYSPDNIIYNIQDVKTTSVSLDDNW